MKTHFPSEWRTQKKWKRRFYSKYMRWLEWLGYATVICVIGAFIVAFNYRVDDVIAADKVPLRAAAESVLADQPTMIVKQLVPNFSEVKSGEAVLEVVEGEEAIKRFVAWQGASELGATTSLTKPTTRFVNAPVSGTVFVAPEQVSQVFEAKAELAQIRDYTHLIATASLTGQGVAKAEPGGTATLKSIVAETHHGILVRGRSGRDSLISGQLGSAALGEKVSSSLAGQSFRVRDDIPLQFSELTEVQIDANMTTQAGSGDGVWLEPSPSTTLTAKVVSGEHAATLQFAQLPPSIRSALESEIQSSLKQNVRTLDGETLSISDLSNINTVIKAKAVPGPAEPTAPLISATALSRTFEAELRIDNPPAYLIAAVKAADRSGKVVTAKVELKTGDRPIATLLLKRS
jgi:hypothetical protein